MATRSRKAVGVKGGQEEMAAVVWSSGGRAGRLEKGAGGGGTIRGVVKAILAESYGTGHPKSVHWPFEYTGVHLGSLQDEPSGEPDPLPTRCSEGS